MARHSSSAVPALQPEPAPEIAPQRPAGPLRQAPLFGPDRSNVLQFPRTAPGRKAARPAGTSVRKPQAASARRGNQQSLDFSPSVPRKSGSRHGNCEVAPVRERCLATAVDAGLILLGMGCFLVTFHALGGAIVLERPALYTFGGIGLLIAFFYYLCWSVLNRETVGMRFRGLRLVNFDGYKPEPRQRVVRILTACVFTVSSIGLLWALVDPEGLTWHDHLSKTFPSLQPYRAN